MLEKGRWIIIIVLLIGFGFFLFNNIKTPVRVYNGYGYDVRVVVDDDMETIIPMGGYAIIKVKKGVHSFKVYGASSRFIEKITTDIQEPSIYNIKKKLSFNRTEGVFKKSKIKETIFPQEWVEGGKL